MKATDKMVRMVVTVSSVMVAWAGVSAWGLESERFRMDARESYGGHVGTSVEWVGEVDGNGGRFWDTTASADRWVTIESQGNETGVCVLNGPAVVGGRLAGDASWDANRVRVVRDDVVVPSGITLTLERGAVVKFTEGARIVVEEGGAVVAKGAHLADALDDTVGGDSNLDGGTTIPGGIEWWLDDKAVAALIGVDWVGGGAGLSKTTYSEGEVFGSLPEIEREDALFGGWFTQPDGAGVRVAPDTQVTAGMTALYAKWTALAVSVDPGHVVAAPTGGRYGVEVTANGAWSAETGADWIDVAGAEGAGDGRMELSVAANENIMSRAATVRVRMARGGAFREVTVTQEGMEQVATPVILPADGTTFEGSSQRVVMSCATDGASIRYTLDGSEPDVGGIPYAGSFNVFDTTTLKAKAFKDGALGSGTAVARLVRLRTLAEAIDQPLWPVVTDDVNGWTVTEETTHDGAYAARSGAVDFEGTSRMETTVEGEGKIGFWWKVSCEDDPDGTDWDRLSFYVDGRLVASIDGDGGWVEVSAKIKGEGVHTLVWEYAKDWYDEIVTEDAGWVDQVTWEPTVGQLEMPVSWMEGLGLLGAGDNPVIAADADPDGDGLTNAQEYFLGTDPNDADSALEIGVEMVDGHLHLIWQPDLVGGNYRVEGKKSLVGDADEEWVDITDGLDIEKSQYNFFRIKAVAPQAQ